MFKKRARGKEKLIESQKWYTEGLKEGLVKSNKWLPDELHGEKPCLEKKDTLIKKIISFIGKPKIFLCSHITVTGPSLERHNEIHIITCSLIFCSFSVKILLPRLLSNFSQ
jgi:hypothetical protein